MKLLGRSTHSTWLLLPLATFLVSCDQQSAIETAEKPLLIIEEASSPGGVTDQTILQRPTKNVLSAVFGASEIPYPVYPNGTKYRVGGENGLKIVVFQTDDAFTDVDEYYTEISDNNGMARLTAMSDYVRYTQGTEDLDPWATHKPGIVIHRFKNEDERRAVGASASAKTNIIMSF